MINGSADEFTSRRTSFIECEYWLVSNEDIKKSKNELILERKSNGTFSAKLENSFDNSSSIIGQAFLFDSNGISISTTDDIHDIKKNCIVSMLGKIWRVDSITMTPIRGNYQMSDDIALKYNLELRR